MVAQEFLKGRVHRFWVPDEFVRISAVPRTSTGKFDKKALLAADSDNRAAVRSGDGAMSAAAGVLTQFSREGTVVHTICVRSGRNIAVAPPLPKGRCERGRRYWPN